MMALRHMQRLAHVSYTRRPLVAHAASRAICSTKNRYGTAAIDFEVMEILLAQTNAPVPAGLASSIIKHQDGDKAHLVAALVDRAIARGADADMALQAAYARGDQLLITHLLVGRKTVPLNSIGVIVAGEVTRRNRGDVGDDDLLFTRIREAAALGADPSEPSHRGCDSALTDAVMVNSAKLVRLLLELGADPSGDDTLWFAIHMKNPDIVCMLLYALAARMHPGPKD